MCLIVIFTLFADAEKYKDKYGFTDTEGMNSVILVQNFEGKM